MTASDMVDYETPDAEFCVTFPNGYEKLLLNRNMAIKQKITRTNLSLLRHAHVYKWQLFKQMQEASGPTELQLLAAKVTETEFYLQELWHFPRNINFHRFWDMPQCDCPQLDNEDRYGTGFVVYSNSCPIHGEHWQQK